MYSWIIIWVGVDILDRKLHGRSGQYRATSDRIETLIGDNDGNFDWTRRFILVNDAISRDCGYPSSVVLKNGRILTLYYATRSKDHPGWKVHCGALLYALPSSNK